MLTQEKLKESLEYNLDTGLFKRVKRASNRSPVGWFEGANNGDGYKRIRVGDKSYLAHRLAFLSEFGFMPRMVDHIDGVRANNRIANLRECSRSQNSMNSKLSTANSSGFKNVYWHKRDKRWAVTVNVGGRQSSFGYYDDLELACLVAEEVRDKYYGEFANHGWNSKEG